MPDIEDIWDDDEYADYERSKMDPRQLFMMELARNQRKREERERAEQEGEG
jgi:hypothetical protein